VASLGLSSGAFRTRFADEPTARAAARDARSVGFVVDVESGAGSGWLTISRRRHPFAADDMARYARRLQTIATAHGGDYQDFVEESGP
jgi:hypothetical protein